MPGRLIGYDSVSKGSTGPYGRAGYRIMSDDGVTVHESLPAWISSVVMAPTATWPSVTLTTDPRALSLPPAIGGVTRRAWDGGSGTLTADITCTDASMCYLVSTYFVAGATNRLVNWWVRSLDGVTTYSNGASPNTEFGLWLRFAIQGSARLAFTNYPKLLGVLVDPWPYHLAGAVPPNTAGNFAL